MPVYSRWFIRVVVYIDERCIANGKNECRRRDRAVNRYSFTLLTGIIDRAVSNVEVIADSFNTWRTVGKMETGMGSLNRFSRNILFQVGNFTRRRWRQIGRASCRERVCQYV